MAGLIGSTRYGAQGSVVLDEMTKLLRVEAVVPDENYGVSKKPLSLFGDGHLSLLVCEEVDGHDVSAFTDPRSNPWRCARLSCAQWLGCAILAWTLGLLGGPS